MRMGWPARGGGSPWYPETMDTPLYLTTHGLSIGKTLIFGFEKPDFWVRDWWISTL